MLWVGQFDQCHYNGEPWTCTGCISKTVHAQCSGGGQLAGGHEFSLGTTACFSEEVHTNPKDLRKAELLRRHLRRRQDVMLRSVINECDAKLKGFKRRHEKLCKLIYGKHVFGNRSKAKTPVCMPRSTAGSTVALQ